MQASNGKILLGKAAAHDVTIDLDILIRTRMLVTASSGGGKSETLRRILEEAVDHIQCIVIDPEGEFSTLREKKPFVLVGEGGETPADIRSAALVATKLLELNASAVCDLYEMKPVTNRHLWVQRFLEAMVNAPKSLWHPVLVVLDEAHVYAPEKGFGESLALQSVMDLASLGRKRGFCLIPATQRLSKLSKNVVEPMQNYLVGRTTFDDQDRACKTFKIPPGKETREFSLQLEQLNDGQFFFRGRAFNGDMLKVQVIRPQTRPPETGTAMAGRVTPVPAAVKALLPQLADLPQEAEKKARTEADLRRDLADAQAKIRQLEKQPAKPDERKVMELMEQITKIQDHVKELETQNRGYQKQMAKARELLVELGKTLEMTLPPIIKLSPQQEAALAKSDFGYRGKIMFAPGPTLSSNGTSLPAGERAVLIVLAQHQGESEDGLAREQIGVFSGYTKVSTRNAYLQRLLQKKFVYQSAPGRFVITDEGDAALGDYERLPEGGELRDWWLQRLPEGERRVLEALFGNGKHGRTREQISELTGYDKVSTRNAYIQRLAQKMLIIVTPNLILPSEHLF